MTAPAVSGGSRHAGIAPLDTVVLKVAQNCNLNCTYCYVYNRGDECWRTRPQLISERVLRQLAIRVREHCGRHAVDPFTIELHGGEPLLLGKRRMRAALALLRAEAAPARLRFTMQTNGVLLDAEWLDLFAEYSLSFGISLDGPPELADRRRVLRRGGGSTEILLARIAALRQTSATRTQWDTLFGGMLCVIDPETDGGALVQWFVDQGFDAFDLLLPDGNRVNPPQGWTGVAAYRRFLLEAFERWYGLGAKAPRIRKFELMMMGLMGAPPRLDSLGGDLRRLCVVESDGTIGVSDVARICGGDYSADILDIFNHALDQHFDGYSLDDVQPACATCRSCPQFDACGGGYLPHRFDGVGFANPSLYCEALAGLGERIQQVLEADLPVSARRGVAIAA